MNEIEAKRFENETAMPFGEHKGIIVWQVPKDYLEWLSDENDFVVQVRRYVKSKRFKER